MRSSAASFDKAAAAAAGGAGAGRPRATACHHEVPAAASASASASLPGAWWSGNRGCVVSLRLVAAAANGETGGGALTAPRGEAGPGGREEGKVVASVGRNDGTSEGRVRAGAVNVRPSRTRRMATARCHASAALSGPARRASDGARKPARTRKRRRAMILT